jgi:polyphosphate kinase 2 (PPK2 family)
MLKEIDLKVRLDKKKFKAIMPELGLKLGELQRAARVKQIPILIVFEGWGASGKGTMINNLIMPLDPRGFAVLTTKAPNEEEYFRPFLWRFWTKIPERGRITIFDRSWYGHVLGDRVDELLPKTELATTYGEIASFERQLAEDGYIIIKFWLHIDKKEQKRRFQALEDDPHTSWRVTREDWQHHRQYEEYRTAAEEMIERTSAHYAPWTIIEAHDERFATVKILRTVAAAVEARISPINPAAAPGKARKTTKVAAAPSAKRIDDLVRSSMLDKLDLSLSIGKEDYTKKIKRYQAQLRDIEYQLYRLRLPMMIVYEGVDAAGKGGNIKRVTEHLDPRGYQVVTSAAPNDIEKAHHYLWRYWTRLPKSGHIAIYDRSWYGRILVERVEGFCSEEEWSRAYQEINEFEEHFANFGGVIVKFWLQISKEEQLKRFKERERVPYKHWKITEEDYRNREKWDAYRLAADEMLIKTGTTGAPWTIVEANSKYFARLKTMKTIIDAAARAIERKKAAKRSSR